MTTPFTLLERSILLKVNVPRVINVCLPRHAVQLEASALVSALGLVGQEQMHTAKMVSSHFTSSYIQMTACCQQCHTRMYILRVLAVCGAPTAT